MTPLKSVGHARFLRWWARVALWIVWLVVIAAVASTVFQVSTQRGIDALQASAHGRLELFASVVESRVRRLETIPATVGLHPSVTQLLLHPSADSANHVSGYLVRLNAHLRSEAVFVLDVKGRVLASSNSRIHDDSQIGQVVIERPYFLEALAGRAARHFAMGVGGRPGYFAAHPVYVADQVVGVAVIKIDLDPIDQTWGKLNVPALLIDSNQVVIWSSEPSWQYSTWLDLTPELRVDLQLSRIYGDQRLREFPLDVSIRVDPETLELSGWIERINPADAAVTGLAPSQAGYLLLGRALDGMDWRVLTVNDLSDVRRQAWIDAAMSALLVIMVALFIQYLIQRRRIERQKQLAKSMLEEANANLEDQVHARTKELTRMVDKLAREVTERRQTETNLRAAQDELIHAGKMAVLGQMAASMTHELSQPLGGIRTLAGNAVTFIQRGQWASASDNLKMISELVAQLAGIIEPLKGFSRKSTARPELLDPARIAQRALFLFQWRINDEAVDVVNQLMPDQYQVYGDANRLQQILVNLISNALDAMRETPSKRLTLAAQPNHDHHMLEIRVSDTGKGLSPVDQQNLFQPFYTTKSNGAGLGLGLVISRDLAIQFGGDLTAENAHDGGAVFVVSVPFKAERP